MFALGVLGTCHIESRQRGSHGEDWARFAAVTSVVPFAAIATGRNRFALGELGAGKIALGLLAYVGMLF